MMTLQNAARALVDRGIDAVAHGDAPFMSVGSDSRNVPAGALFVALRGERFDGHDYVAGAGAAGAAAALVDDAWFRTQAAVPALPCLVVHDTRRALGQLAAVWRARFVLPLIGITGSNGKTTTKEMCAAIWRAELQQRGEAAEALLATRGNLNNDIGLPLTLLALRDAHRAAIIEMGMNHPGEIAWLADIARPTVALVTNAQRAHLEGLGGLQQIAQEKGAIYDGLLADGIAIVNGDDRHAGEWRARAGQRTVWTFSLHGAADVQGDYTPRGLSGKLGITWQGERREVELLAPGAHNASNALAAAAACLASGASLDAVIAGLGDFKGVQGRLQRVAGPRGALILDDSYNANPDSLRAGIDVLTSTPGRKVLVLGDMFEAGEAAAQLHDEIGGYAKSKGVDALFALGEMSRMAVRNFDAGGTHYSSPEKLARALYKQLDPSTVVLVKGSRSMRMERVVEQLAQIGSEDAA